MTQPRPDDLPHALTPSEPALHQAQLPTTDQLPDEQWQRLRAGDEAARVALYEKHREGLRRWFRAKVPYGVDADDCVSEVFVRALDGIARDADIRDGVDQWLWGIARYVLIEQFKAKKRRGDEEFEDAGAEDPARHTVAVGAAVAPPEPGLVYGKQQAFDALYDAAASLSRTQRTVVSAYLDRSLAEMREFKGAELAAYLDWPDKKVHTELHRGMSKVFENVGLLAAARAMRSCPGYPELTDNQGPLHAMFEGDRAGARLVPTRREYAALKRHAPACPHCSVVMRDAVREKQWALGPGIALVAAQHNADDDERRRAVVAWWSGRGPSAAGRTPTPPPAVGAATEAGASLASAASTGAGPLGAVGRVVRQTAESVARPIASAARTSGDALLRQALRVPGVNTAVNAATRVAAENPMAVRVGGALVALGTAAAVTLAAVAPGDASQAPRGPDRPRAVATAPPDTAPGNGTSPTPTDTTTPSGGATTQAVPPAASPPPGGGPATGPSGPGTGAASEGPNETGGNGSPQTGDSPPPPPVGGDTGVGSERIAGNGSGSGGGTGPTGRGTVIDPPGNPPVAIPATWAFWQLRYPDDPIGTTRDLGPSAQHPGNGESNWTYGSWRLGAQAGRTAQVTHVAKGVHVVTLPEAGAPGGVAHANVNVLSDTGASCQTVSWRQQGADEAVEVACFDRFGAPVDVPFTGVFLGGTQNGPNTLGVSRGYVHASDPTAARQEPGPASRQNTGAVRRTGTGSYTTVVPPAASAVQVTPVGSAARHCAVTGLGGGSASISCTTYAGVPADTGFVLSHTGGQSLLDDRRVPHGASLVASDAPGAVAPAVGAAWMSRPGSADITRTATGRYSVTFNLGYLPSYTHVTATGGGYCSTVLRNDYSRKDGTNLTVACFTASGTPVNSGFRVTYMTASPNYP